MNDDSALRRLVACCLTASGLSARARLNPEKARHLAAQIERSFLYDAGHWSVPEAVLPARPGAGDTEEPGTERGETHPARQVIEKAILRGIRHARALALQQEERNPAAARNLTLMLRQNGVLQAGTKVRHAPCAVYDVASDAPEELTQSELAGMTQVSGPDFIRHARTWLLGEARLEALEDGAQLFLDLPSGALSSAFHGQALCIGSVCIGSASHSTGTYFIVPPGQPLALTRVLEARQLRRARALKLVVAQVQQRAADTSRRLGQTLPDPLPLTLLIGHHPGYAVSAIVGEFKDEDQQQQVITAVQTHLEHAGELWRQLTRPPAGGPVPDPSTSGGASTEVHWAKLSADLLAAAEALCLVSALPQTG